MSEQLQPNPNILPPTGTPELSLVSRETWQTDIVKRHNLGRTSLSNLVEPLNIRDVEDFDLSYRALTNAIDTDGETDASVASLSQRIEAIKWPASEKVKTEGNPFLSTSDSPPLVDRRPLVMQDPEITKYLGKRDISDSHKLLTEAWPDFTKTFSEGVQHGIDLGYIPSSVASRVESALTQTKVRMADAAILDNAAGVYSNANDEVWVRHDLEELGDSTQNLLVHELTHKLSGGTFTGEDTESPPSYRPRTGFSTELRNKETRLRTGLNEAVTQHVTMGIVTGDFETFNPDQREDGDRGYYEYRKVVGTFIDRSHGLVDVKTLVNAFYEDTGPQGSTEARRKLIGEVKTAYGSGALNKLEKLCKLTEIVDDKRFDEIILSRIHAPEIDEQGNVVKSGWIDTENLPTFFDLYKK